MKKKEILAKNILIAEFNEHFKEAAIACKKSNVPYDWKNDAVELNALRYHESMDLLMTVINRIISNKKMYVAMHSEKNIHECEIYSMDIEDRVSKSFYTSKVSLTDAVFNCIAGFIEKYPTNKRATKKSK